MGASGGTIVSRRGVRADPEIGGKGKRVGGEEGKARGECAWSEGVTSRGREVLRETLQRIVWGNVDLERFSR